MFKALGDVGQFIRGIGLLKGDLTDEGVPAIHYGQIHTTYGTWAAETVAFVRPAFAAKLRKARPGDIVIATTSEDDQAVGKAMAWIGNDEAAVSSDAYIFRHSLVPKYVAYIFQSDGFQDQKQRWITGTKVRRISGESLAKIRIPVPPRAVQEEIVRLLDLLEALDATFEVELEAELGARRRQFAHVRESLLTSRNADVPWMAMGELGQFIRGRRFTKDDVVEDGIPSIHYGEIYTRYGTAASKTVSHVRRDLASKLRYARPGDVIVAAVGETVEDVAKAVAWLGEEPVAIHDDTFLFRSEMNPTFVSYAMQTAAFHAQKNKYVDRAKVKRLSGDALGKIAIPVPAIEEQERIVEILDRFDALVQGLSAELRAELAARHLQYRYYRNHLLTFAEAAA
jgi:type I restriction enzyme S subunit